MQFESRVFSLAKDAEHPEQDQDACRIDGPRGVAAIADGVSSGIFSRQWAAILTDAVLADLPDPGDPEPFARWLTLRREAWAAGVDVSKLAWHQKPKLRQGAFSTLLCVRLVPDPEAVSPDGWRLRGFAVGDSCLIHVRQKQWLSTFPIERSAELEANPVVVGSMDLNRDQLVQFRPLDRACLPGDLVVLCTDAVAGWALRLSEHGQAPDWEAYWDMSEQAWRDEIMALRNQSQIRVDDATLALLRVTAGGPAPRRSPPAEAPLPREAESQDPWADTLRVASDKMKEVTQQASEKVKEASEKMKEVTQQASERVKEVTQQASEKVKEASEKVRARSQHWFGQAVEKFKKITKKP